MQVEGQHGLSLLRLMATGARVRNAYATCPIQEDNPSKDGLILRMLTAWHQEVRKEIRYRIGMRPISLLVR